MFVSLPSEVRSGQPFAAEWRVEGPEGTSGDSSTLRVSYAVSSSRNGAQASSSSKSQQSFGSFTVPKTFSTRFSYAGASGDIVLTATAKVGGQTVSAERTVRLAP